MLSAYKGRIISILRLKNTKNMKINKIVKTALVSCVIFGFCFCFLHLVKDQLLADVLLSCMAIINVLIWAPYFCG